MTDFAERSAKLADLRERGLAPLTYEIVIDEPMREALLELIRSTGADRPGTPLEYWDAMLAALPADEAAAPGTVHGFCL